MEPDPKIEEINKYLKRIVPNLKQRGGQPLNIIAWVTGIKSNGVVMIGLAMDQGTGCSPFCGCAAKELSVLLEEKLRQKFPWITKVRGVAMLPPKKVEKEWRT